MSGVHKEVCAWAKALGATHIRPITDRGFLQAKESVRDCCLSNSCGKSGRCWVCPPHVGDFADLAARLLSYTDVFLVQTIATIEDSWDFEGMTEAANTHNTLMRDIRHRILNTFPDYDILALGSGGCGYCERCSCPDLACPFPDEALGSVEGYGLDVKPLVESVGLHYINGINTVSYVGGVFLRKIST